MKATVTVALNAHFAAGILAALSLGTASGAAAPFSCAELEGVKPEVHLEYLQRDRSALKPDCIFYAMGSLYPAITALFEIGKPAIPDLVGAIADPDTSDVARSNAIEALFLIHREDVSEAVALLNRASKEAPDWQSSQRLMDAARRMADMCRGPAINSCLNALQ
jgi:hypothetical protein